MKKTFIKLTSFILSVTLLLSLSLSFPASAKETFSPVLRFAVATDTHIKGSDCVELQRLDSLFKTTYSYADSQSYKSVDAFVFCGDSANTGARSEWELFNGVVKENLREGTEFMMSFSRNHEHWSIFNRMPYEVTGVKGYNSLEIKGFRFITVPQDKYFDYFFSGLWLAGELYKAKAADPEKPIFVFQHEHISGTVYGSDDWGTVALTPVLNPYPQVINFSGHSHYPVNDPRSVNQKKFTSFGAGTLSYFELEDGMVYGTVPPKADNAAQFYIVEVNAENTVRVMPYDLISGDFFKSPSSYSSEQLVYEIKEPSNRAGFVYTDERYKAADSPVFTKSAAVSVTPAADTAEISFPQATDGDNIHSYRIVLTDADSGKALQDFKIWSEFYFVPIPETLSYSLTGLSPKTAYKVSVTAIDSYGKTSAPIVAAFKTL